jgi:integrase
MPGTARRPRRTRGSIDQLPSGQYRVRVYAGTDPLTGKRHDLVEVAETAKDAEKVRTKLLSQLDERRNPRTKATVAQLMKRYLETAELAASTRKTYAGYVRNHVDPVLGQLQVSQIDGEVLDTFYGMLRTCRARCRSKAGVVDHRTARKHECDQRCLPHECRPMGASTVRQIHHILSGALSMAVRWRWLSHNPVQEARPPSVPTPNPQPPTAEQAARILDAAWAQDGSFATLVWLVMVTGARRGEICGIRRAYVDLDNAVLVIPKSISEIDREETDTKTHQQRRLALDEDTVEVLRAHLAHMDAVAEALGAKPDPRAFIFSYSPTGDVPIHPSTVTHKYGRLVSGLGLKTTLHNLRHYNATELIAAGVDIRTIAGRLGHGGGGTTTLRVYAAWVSEADQRAAATLGARLPRTRRTGSS